MINAESLLSDVRGGKINFADLSEEQLRYFFINCCIGLYR